ncbi:hypothetical protein [Stackebrandtia nassauensis]|uniref:Uncharacterized protein n=1 Tax=Stackebrandtia nassauensis (strain DSM 44728 / CIP 108903 / NRRL B-16338 / NBRC 102104 / LLR-40K-21) TaxID=446470 RepID=D3PYD3_STANL|nr:hypothetical protein [Stackebrandtia nassauensis]ADD41500.1 hypothetical protein Snas_1804 [Stackebrandtia nassauensis DSM 44728]
MRKWVFVAGVAVGYVLGARAGRERYEQIAAMARRVRDNPTVRNVTGMLQDQAGQAAGACKDRLMATSLGERFFGERDEFAVGDDIKPRYWETVGVSTPARDNVGGNEPREP